jgi:hypothetical protein
MIILLFTYIFRQTIRRRVTTRMVSLGLSKTLRLA